MTTPSSLHDVLSAFADGARTVDDLARRTDLDPELVRVALDQLVAIGLVESAAVAGGACPPNGCGACPTPGATGCPPARGSLVTLTLGRRPSD